MDLAQALLLIIATSMTGLLAILTALIRERRAHRLPVENPYAAATEGDKRCPKCGMGSPWIARHCISCGTRLAG
jgi:hypothetical protein